MLQATVFSKMISSNSVTLLEKWLLSSNQAVWNALQMAIFLVADLHCLLPKGFLWIYPLCYNQWGEFINSVMHIFYWFLENIFSQKAAFLIKKNAVLPLMLKVGFVRLQNWRTLLLLGLGFPLGLLQLRMSRRVRWRVGLALQNLHVFSAGRCIRMRLFVFLHMVSPMCAHFVSHWLLLRAIFLHTVCTMCAHILRSLCRLQSSSFVMRAMSVFLHTVYNMCPHFLMNLSRLQSSSFIMRAVTALIILGRVLFLEFTCPAASGCMLLSPSGLE